MAERIVEERVVEERVVVDPDTTRSTGSLFSEALSHMSSLVRKEVDLARAEMSENAKRAAVAIGMLAAGLVMALVALIVLAFALVDAIADAGLDGWIAALIVGGILAIIAFALAAKGASDLKNGSLAPTRTAENVKRDTEAVKGAL